VGHEVKWLDHGHEPQCSPNPAYPVGIDLDISEGATRACKVTLPYPAKRCEVWVVKCFDCGNVVGCTTAGRPDDPRTIKMPCKSAMQ
jgi:hypothetical protein